MLLKDTPIKRKLMAILLLTSGSVLLLTCASFFAYEFFASRQSAIRQLSTIGEIIAANSTAALVFDNPDDAKGTLMALKAERHIAAACLYDNNGKIFSTYPADLMENSFPAAPVKDGYRFEHSHLTSFQPVLGENGKRLGTLYLKSDMELMYQRFRLYGGIAVCVIAASFMVAYMLSRVLQSQISTPILALAQTAKAVSDRRDYSVRASKLGKDELGQLTDAFNEMLTRLQEQLGRLDLLHRITRAIGDRQDLPSIFQAVLRNLHDNLPLDFSCMCLYDPSSNALTVISLGLQSQVLREELAISEQARIPIEQNGLSRCVRGELVYEPDVSTVESSFPQRLAWAGLRSLVAAPLLVESKVFGALITARREPHAFSSAECEFLQQLSEHVALAANQAQLYSELQQAYEDLRQTQQSVMQQERLKALGQMASGIAHDINNAISPVALYTESLLEREPGLSDRARDYLRTIQRAIEDVAQTVSRMREFYRHREPQLTLAPIDLNLIFNGVDAMPDGGTLTLRTCVVSPSKGSECAALVNLEVRDTGVGMDETTKRRCVEPFFTTKGERGTGLGLAMVYGMAQRHSAEIEIESEPGKGTAVRLIFQVSTPPASSALNPSANLKSMQRLRILLVDDDPLLIKSLRDILESDGHFITAADGGQAGIKAFAEAQTRGEPFAVVITDLGMPYTDGRKVAASVKAAAAATPVILLTGWGQRMIAEQNIPPGVDRVLSKPPKLNELRSTLAELTASR